MTTLADIRKLFSPDAPLQKDEFQLEAEMEGQAFEATPAPAAFVAPDIEVPSSSVLFKPKKGSRVLAAATSTHAWRDANQEDLRKWYASDESKGMDDAGETKLPPRSVSQYFPAGTRFTVLRARVKAQYGYHDVRGCCWVRDEDGSNWYIRRKDLVLVLKRSPLLKGAK